MNPTAAYPASSCQPMTPAVKTSLHTGIFFRRSGHILTWFVTSSVVGLYVVIPCVPTEKTLLYLKHRHKSETHLTYNSTGCHTRSASSEEQRLCTWRPLNMWELWLFYESGKSLALCLFHNVKSAAIQFMRRRTRIHCSAAS